MFVIGLYTRSFYSIVRIEIHFPMLLFLWLKYKKNTIKSTVMMFEKSFWRK